MDISLNGTIFNSYYRSVDVERICLGVEEFHEIWAAILALFLGFALLYLEADWTAFLPIAVLLIALGVTSYLAKMAGTRQTKWSAQTDVRIKYIVRCLVVVSSVA